MLVYTLLLLTCFVQIESYNIPCGNEPNSWQSGKNIQIQEREKIVSTRYENVDVIVDSKDGMVSKRIIDTGTWEPRNIYVLKAFVKQGFTVLNIGSHIGLEAIVMGKIVGEKGKLFIFEPFSVSYNMVLKNVYLNQLGNITTVYNVGASNKYSTGYINVDISNTGGSEIFTDPSLNKAPHQSQLVQVDRVEDVLPDDVVVDFALIDVERMEVECMQGMKEVISRSPNMVILTEWSGYSFNSRDFQNKKRNLLNWFVSLKYKFYQLAGFTSGQCGHPTFNQLTLEQIWAIKHSLRDFYFVPGHINPNKA